MGAGHGHNLHYHGHTVIHRLPAHAKLVALLLFVITVVLTPRTAIAAFVAYAAILGGVAALTRVPAAYLLKRMVVEVPFVVFALVLPVVATGPRVQVGPFTVSEAGLWGAWGLLAKGSLGVLASVLFGATTEPREMVRALEKLRLPQPLVQIAAFMIRYLEVVAGEMQRMRIARESRGFRARSVRQWPVLASSLGALFIRSFERGERVHLAMLSRGYAGRLPFADQLAASGRQWATALALPAAGATVLAAAVLA
ncbi:MAG: cobalt ECF transporter T component CbiQ [Tetrasphaera sp.]